MAGWQVKLERFPGDAMEHFSRIWRKHDHAMTEEGIREALLALGAGRVDGQVIARYEEKESVERVLAEIENLNGEGSVTEVADS